MKPALTKMRKFHLPVAQLKTDDVQEVLAKLSELEKQNSEICLFIRHLDDQNREYETPFVGTISDIKKYLQSAIGETSVNMFAAKMRSIINS